MSNVIPLTPLPLCQCGCGSMVEKVHHQYIHGHHLKKLHDGSGQRRLGSSQLCFCGCGKFYKLEEPNQRYAPHCTGPDSVVEDESVFVSDNLAIVMLDTYARKIDLICCIKCSTPSLCNRLKDGSCWERE